MQTQNGKHITEKAVAWLNNQKTKLNKPSTLVMPNIFAQEWNHSNFSENALALRSGADAINPFFSPSAGSATDDYSAAAKKNASTGSAPVSIQEGLQTSIDIARRRSGYNPLDQPTVEKPHTAGDRDHFIAFTNQIAEIPFLSLLSSQVSQIQQKSHNADDLINSFVDGFMGLKNQDVADIKKSLTQLTQAALSYANQTEEQSNFNQNILQQGDGEVFFMLYASEFSIRTTSRKGVITFQSSYILSQAMYSLSVESWNNVKDVFSNQQKTDTTGWLNDTTTQPKTGSTVRAICLEGK